MNAWTCLRLLCECENVSRLWVLERVLLWKIETLWMIGPSLHIRLWMAEWTTKFRSANPRSDGVLWEIRSEMDSHIDNVVEPTGVDMQAQEVCMQIVWYELCLCKLFDTNSTELTKTVISMSHCEAIVRLTRKGWGGYIKTQSRYQWGWDGAIKTQSRYLGNQDPVKLLGQVLRSILWHVLNEFVLQDVHEEGLRWYLYHPRCDMICSSWSLWGGL